MFGKKKPDFKFELGSKVKDVITGFDGIIIYRTQWLNNCNTYGVKPTVLKDGIPMESQHFDEPQLELIKEKVHKAKQDTGGPCESVKRTNR